MNNYVGLILKALIFSVQLLWIGTFNWAYTRVDTNLNILAFTSTNIKEAVNQILIFQWPIIQFFFHFSDWSKTFVHCSILHWLNKKYTVFAFDWNILLFLLTFMKFQCFISAWYEILSSYVRSFKIIIIWLLIR